MALNMSGTDATIVHALRAGARGCLLKSAGRDEVLSAIRGVVHSGTGLSADVAARLAALADVSLR